MKNVILRGFSRFDGIESAQYLTCGQNNMLIHVEQEVDSDGVFELAGQGSLYLTKEPVEVI